MKVSISQPAYLPWLGYFDRIAQSDLHIVLDHVQLERGSKGRFTNRNKVRVPDGWRWLTVPVSRHPSDRINELCVVGWDWARKHEETLRRNYGRTPHFQMYWPHIAQAYSAPAERLIEVIERFTPYLLKVLDIKTPILRSSEMRAHDTKDLLILQLCQEVGATAYISGPFGRDYLTPGLFEEAGIELLFHDYNHPVYSQAFPGFEAGLSAVDLLFNMGDQSRTIITGAKEKVL